MTRPRLTMEVDGVLNLVTLQPLEVLLEHAINARDTVRVVRVQGAGSLMVAMFVDDEAGELVRCRSWAQAQDVAGKMLECARRVDARMGPPPAPKRAPEYEVVLEVEDLL